MFHMFRTFVHMFSYTISLRIRDAGIAIESSRGACVYISDDMGWVVSVVAAIGLGVFRVSGGEVNEGSLCEFQELTQGG